jgi:imidazolonepropionase-like amidohydrolase
MFLSLGIAQEDPGAKSPKASPIVLQHATIHTQGGKGTFVGSIVIDDGKILALGETVDVPEGVSTVDLTGCHIVPGLIESRSKLWLTSAAATETNTKAELDVVDAIDPWSEDWRELAAQGITSVFVQPNSDSFLGGYGAVLRVGPYHTPEQIVLKKEVAIQASIGTKGATSKDRYTQVQSLEKLFESAKEKKKTEAEGDKKEESAEASDDTTGDESDDEPEEDSEEKEKEESADAASKTDKDKPETDPTKLALRRILNKEIPLHIEVHHSDVLKQILALAKKLEIRIVLDGLSQLDNCGDELSSSGFPMVVGPLYESGEAPGYRKDASFDWLKSAADSDQLWALSSFGQSGRLSRLLRVQAAMAIGAGVDSDKVLAAITSNPARMLGVSDQIGSLEVGKSADIAVFAGDPLDPCTPTRLVMSGGQVTFENEAAPMAVAASKSTALPERLPSEYSIKSTRLLMDGKFVEGVLSIKDGKIVSTDKTVKSKKAPVFDLQDTVVTPGLVIASSTLDQSSTIDDPTESDASHLRSVDAVDPNTETAKKALAGGFVHIALSPGTTNTSAGVIGHLRLGAVDYVANPAVASQFVLTGSARKDDRFPSSLNGQLQLLSDLFEGQPTPSSVYVTSAIGRSIAQEKIANVASVKSGKRPAIIVADSKLEIRSALSLAKANGVAPVLLSSGRVGEFADQLADGKFGLIIPGMKGDEYDAALEQILAVHRAGVPLAFSGDSPEKIRLTAAMLVNAGLPPTSALLALTEGAGKMVGLEKTGFAKGSPADLVVWSDSPLNLAAKPLNVVVDGQNISQK